MITKFILLLCLGLASVGTIIAAPEAVNTDKEGVALEGYDPVAFFTDKKPVKGLPENKATVDGATYYFASAEHLAAFKAEPKKYQPAYGGFCAYGVSAGHKAPVKIETAQVINDRLYLNYNLDVKKDFDKNQADLIAKADANWPKISNQ